MRVDLNTARCDALVPEEEIARDKLGAPPPTPPSHTPWEELYRAHVGSPEQGGCLDFTVKYQRIGQVPPRHNHLARTEMPEALRNPAESAYNSRHCIFSAEAPL